MLRKVVSRIMLAILLLAFTFPINPAHADVQNVSLNLAQITVQNISITWIINTTDYKEAILEARLKEGILRFYFKVNVIQNCSETYYNITIVNPESLETWVLVSVPDTLYDAPSGVTVETWRLDIPSWVVDILIPILLVTTIVLVIYFVYQLLTPLLSGELLEFISGLGGFLWASIPWIFLTLCMDKNPDRSLTLYFPYSPSDYVLGFLMENRYVLATELNWWEIVKKSYTFLWITFTWFEAIWLYWRIPSPPPLNRPPSASFIWWPEAPFIWENVTFVSTCFDPDGHIVDFYWCFGDGYEATGQNVTHQYIKAGKYNVTLQVIDDGALSTTISSTITVIVPATLDVDPTSLNLRSEGKWITAYIELPEGYDVNDLNVSTIMLNGTVLAELSPIAIGDYDNDTIPDLMVKFNKTEDISYILANVNMTELIEERFMTLALTITGKLYDRTPFQGSDTIKIILPMPRRCDGCRAFPI